MFRIAAAVFFVLHGLVHLWYVVLSNNWVAVEDAMGWNGHSWLLSPQLPSGTILSLASGLYLIVTIGFVVGAVGYWLDEKWATTLLASAALLSSAVLVVMWDGRPDLLVEKGILGILINIGILVFLFR